MSFDPWDLWLAIGSTILMIVVLVVSATKGKISKPVAAGLLALGFIILYTGSRLLDQCAEITWCHKLLPWLR
jgi:hypothetical protein